MNIITEPNARLIGRLTIDDAELAGFLEDEGVSTWTSDAEVAAEKIVEVAGRLCYKSYAKPRPGGNAEYIGHILDVGHGSVIEHAVYNFIITGVSRSFSHELVRHRAGFAYSQRSQRFVDEKSCNFVVPPLIQASRDSFLDDGHKWGVDEDQDTIRDLDGMIWGRWQLAVSQDEMNYAILSDLIAERIALTDRGQSDKTLQRKRAREAARSVLPNATETQIFVTANARALRHFIEARGGSDADAEIRCVAIRMLRILQVESHNLFGDYKTAFDQNGSECVICTTTRKV